MAEPIIQLANLITSSIAQLRAICQEQNLVLPDLNQPFSPQSEDFRRHPQAAHAASLIGAAALQLAATLLPPQETLFQTASGHMKSAALSVCTQHHIPELLREGGPQGTHVDAIARQSNLDRDKIARFLRALSNRHIFREVSPDVFANNRISSLLDTNKSTDDLYSNPAAKHDGTSGRQAHEAISLTEQPSSASLVLDNLRDPITSTSQEAHHAPLQRAHNVDKPLYDWINQPEQEYRRRRLGLAMGGISEMETEESILNAFDWARIPYGGTVVDVGGGLGMVQFALNKAYPQLKLVIEDRPEVVADGLKLWNEKRPEAISSQQVRFIPHNFFGPQPGNILSPTVFILRNILHNWSDQNNIRLLKYLRMAAGPYTKLLIMGHVTTYTCREPPSASANGTPAQGSAAGDPPAPLLPNYGAANDMTYTWDMAMLMWHNAQAHTIKHLNRLLEDSGWRMTYVRRNDRLSGRSLLDVVHASPL